MPTEIYSFDKSTRLNAIAAAADQYCLCRPSEYLAFSKRNGEALQDALVRAIRVSRDPQFGFLWYWCDNIKANSTANAIDRLWGRALLCCHLAAEALGVTEPAVSIREALAADIGRDLD